MILKCLRCLVAISEERKALGFSRCVKCQPQWTYKGALNFGHKTGGAIQPLHPEAFRVFKKVSMRKGKQTHGASFQQGTTNINITDA